MKKFLLAVAFSALHTVSPAAGGAWDGIYSCGFSVLGQTYNVYLTINGQPDGRAIYAVAAVSNSVPFYGYGIGAIAGNVFSGATLYGHPFRATATSTGFNGTVGTLIGNQVVNGTGTCTKVW